MTRREAYTMSVGDKAVDWFGETTSARSERASGRAAATWPSVYAARSCNPANPR